MVHNIHINGQNETLSIHFIGYYMANLTYKIDWIGLPVTIV